MRNYIRKAQAGEPLARPLDAIRAERDRLVRGYTAVLPTNQDRELFQAKLSLARALFPYIENHNFYVEHWFQSVFWRKIRELGRVFAGAGFFQSVDDIFYLRRDEVATALFDLCSGWAVGAASRGPRDWPREVERRKRIIEPGFPIWTDRRPRDGVHRRPLQRPVAREPPIPSASSSTLPNTSTTVILVNPA